MCLFTQRLTLVLSLTAGAMTAVVGQNAVAQDAAAYPNKPITLMVGFAAGAATDGAARLIAPELSRQLGQAIIVENVGGAGGALGAQRVIRANPDGYTLLFGTLSETVLVPIVNRAAGYKTSDLLPIGKIGSTSPVLVGNPRVPARDIDELISLLKQKPGLMNLGHPGVGTFQHLTAASIAKNAGVEWTHVAYKGTAPLSNDLLGGQIELAVMALPSALPLLNSGKLKSFGLIRAQRDPMHKDLPSINEGKSIAGMDADLWIGLFAPKNTPPAVLKKLSDALQATLANSEFKAAQKKLGSSVPEGGSPASFARFLDGEEKKFQAIASTIKLD